MENEKNFDKNGVYSKRVRAGKRRTYFFDVRTTRANDYYLTITESKKRADDDTYERHKIFIYKEDFMKFVNAMQETVDYIKTELLPDYDFDAHNYDDYEEGNYKTENNGTTAIVAEEETEEQIVTEKEDNTEVVKPVSSTLASNISDEAEKWD
ncbi:MAG TPA: DUF3276 family protein [Chitinophagales bacterium]|nr:DUF3276 family protein [Chitinophagales bacterium]